jgi:heat shock protein HslJ
LSERIVGVWTLVSRQLPGESAVAAPAATFTFQVTTEGRAAVRADCNQCGGAASVGAGTVTVGPALACTRAFCSTAPFDTRYVQMLSGDSAAEIDGDTLTLRSDRGTLRFQR